MIKDFVLEWDDFKKVVDKDGLNIYWFLRTGVTTSYVLSTSTPVFMAECSLSETATNDISAFETGYKKSNFETESDDGARALSLAGISSAKAMPVEINNRVGRPSFMQWTIVSHDYTDETTWYQQSEQVTSQVLTSITTSYLEYGLSHENWINPRHPLLFNQSYNEGVPPYEQRALWLSDGTMAKISDFDPIVRTNGVTQSSGYSLDYAAGKVIFDSAQTESTTVDVDYWKATTNEFLLRPRAGKCWEIPRVEINTTDGLVFEDTTIFQMWRDPTYGFTIPPYMLAEMRYQSLAQIQASATTGMDEYPASMGGTSTYDPCADNGWGTGYKRGTSQKSVIFPWVYRKPFILKEDMYDSIRVFTTSMTTPHSGADYLTVTFYVEEDEC